MMRFGNAVKWLAIVAVSLAAIFALSGCGDKKPAGAKSYEQDQTLGKAGKVTVNSENDFSKEQQEVIDLIAKFADATEAKDYKKICEEILSKESQKIGGDCVGMFEKTGTTIKDFKIVVSAVTIDADGKTATAEATTETNGQKGASQALTLAKDEKGAWRVTILGE